MRFRLGLVTALALPLLYACPVWAQTTDPIDAALDAVLAKLKSGDAAGAIAGLDKPANLSPAQTIRARYYRAFALRQKGDLESALAEYHRFLPTTLATQGERDSFKATGGIYGAKAEVAYADTLFSAERFAEAGQAYGLFAGDYPAHAQTKYASFRREESLRKTGAYQAALDYLQTLPKGDPDWEIPAAVRQVELLAQFMRKDYATSNKLPEDIIAKYPSNPAIREAKCRLARNYLYDMPAKQRDYAKARAMEEQLIKDYPDWNMVFEMRRDIANSYLYGKEYAKAVAKYQEMLTDFVDNYPKDNWHANIRFMLGDAQYRAGDKPAAYATWKAVIASYPDDSWARLAIRRLTAAGVM